MDILSYTADKAMNDCCNSTSIVLQENKALEHLLKEIRKYALLGCAGCIVETELQDTIVLQASLVAMGYTINIVDNNIEIKWA